MNIENKTVLITGANRGIGKALECRCVLRVRRAERVLGTRSHDSRSWHHEMEGGAGILFAFDRARDAAAEFLRVHPIP